MLRDSLAVSLVGLVTRRDIATITIQEPYLVATCCVLPKFTWETASTHIITCSNHTGASNFYTDPIAVVRGSTATHFFLPHSAQEATVLVEFQQVEDVLNGHAPRIPRPDIIHPFADDGRRQGVLGFARNRSPWVVVVLAVGLVVWIQRRSHSVSHSVLSDVPYYV